MRLDGNVSGKLRMNESGRRNGRRCTRWRCVDGWFGCCWVKQKSIKQKQKKMRRAKHEEATRAIVFSFSRLLLKIHVWQRCWTLDFPVEVIFGERTRKLSSTQLSHLIYLRYSWKVLPRLLVSACPRTGWTSGSPGAPNHSPHAHAHMHTHTLLSDVGPPEHISYYEHHRKRKQL